MPLNVRNKGQNGEREICDLLNTVVNEIYFENELKPLQQNQLPFQRNQNQTAVGGSDITNPYGLSIEVKRQETLSVDKWWQQCVKSAEQEGGKIPILIYRQNRKKWHVRMQGILEIPDNHFLKLSVPVEISMHDFLYWAKEYCLVRIMARPPLDE